MIAPNAGCWVSGADWQSLADPFWEGSRRVWSLWEMVNFKFYTVHHLIQEIQIHISVGRQNMDYVDAVGGYHTEAVKNDAGAPEAIKQALEGIARIKQLYDDTIGKLNCSHTDRAMDQLAQWSPDKRAYWAELNSRARALRDAIDTELQEYLYFQYPKQKGVKLIAWKSDWAAALAAYSSIERDVFCAIDCYGLGHNTASVFHCMRILEHGLGVLARSVEINFDVQQWNTIIEQIESKITELRKTLPRGVDKNERMQFLSESAKEFFYFKDGWRNYVSHNRGAYDEHQAAGILEHVRAFMNHLSTQLSD